MKSHYQKEATSPNIYGHTFVSSLFDRMSKTYGVVNYIASLGFAERWRKTCVCEIDWAQMPTAGYDLMSGMGECWPLIMARTQSQLIAVDISAQMNTRAVAHLAAHPEWDIEQRKENILDNDLSSGTADFVLSVFGLKTFSKPQQQQLAKEVARLLKPGGQFAFLEISVPPAALLRIPYLFYLKHCVPLIGKLFMGNSADYRMLGVYTEHFNDCHHFASSLRALGLQVTEKQYFWGCATGVVGKKYANPKPVT